MPVDEIVESSPTTETAQGATSEPGLNLESFSREERAEWYKSGALPKSKPAESASAGETSAPPAGDKPAQAKKDAATSFKELREKADAAEKRAERLEAENAELKKGVKAPPAEAKQEPKPPAERPKRLSMEEFILANPAKDWKDYESYKDDYAEQLADWKAKQAVSEYEQELSKQKTKHLASRIERALKADPTIKEVLDMKDYPMTRTIDQFIVENDDDMLIYSFLGRNPEENKRISAMTVIGQKRALNKLLDKFYPDEEAAPAAESKPAASQPVPKKTSAASPPPATVAGNGSIVDDPVKSAVVSGDFASFARMRNQQDIEAFKTKGHR